MSESPPGEVRFIEGTITEGELAGLRIRIGPISRDWNLRFPCDTVFATETCHATPLEVRSAGGEHKAASPGGGERVLYSLLLPCDTVNSTSNGC